MLFEIMIQNSTYSGKRVLVTGHTGFKGAWLSLWLESLGAKVHGLSLEPTSTPNLFDILELKQTLDHRIGDIRNISTVQKSFSDFKPEIVFHLAAQPLVRYSYQTPQETFDTNVMGTVNILEAMRSCPSVRAAVMVTTDKVYLNQEHTTGYVESDPLGGKDPYSASKSCAENVIYSYARSFFSEKGAPIVASARAGNVIGGGDWSADRIVPDAIRAWGVNQPLVLRFPSAVRPWQHVLDCLDAYLQLGSKLLGPDGEKFRGEAYNFGPAETESLTVLELINSLREFWPNPEQARIEIQENQLTRKQETQNLRLICKKAHQDLGWRPLLNVKQAAELTAQWYSVSQKDSGSLKELSLRQIKSVS